MNVLDFVILLLFGGVIAAGFFVGIGKAVSAGVAMYFATVMAATFYDPLAGVFKRLMPDMSTSTADLVAFSLLFVFASAAITYIIVRSAQSMSTANRFAILNNIGGAAVGGIVAAVGVALAVTVTVVFVQALAQASAEATPGTALSVVGSLIKGSALAPVFLDLLPYVTRVVEPWFPGGLPPILTAVPSA